MYNFLHKHPNACTKKAALPVENAAQNLMKKRWYYSYLSSNRYKYRTYSLLRRFVRPKTTALTMRLRMSTTLSSFSVSVSAVIVPAAVKMASAISAQYSVSSAFMLLCFFDLPIWLIVM